MINTNIVKLKYLKTSWRKAGQLLDLIRGKKANNAIGILTFANKVVAPEILKAIKSGINNLKETPENVLIKEVFVAQGTTTKRLRPGPMGRASMYRKKTCTVTLKLERIA
jgi:large subunit ribosomal protein L22